MARKLTFVPADHEYHECQEPRTPLRLMFFHFDPVELRIHPALGISDVTFTPRLFFEDPTLWGTVLKLTGLLESPAPDNRLYFEALGVVLVHELARLYLAADRPDPKVRGGLAAWQRRVVTAYINDHLAEQIPLATLARLARLSPYHFCRTFKKSFGVPPHRYHARVRIERAKVLLEKRPLSVDRNRNEPRVWRDQFVHRGIPQGNRCYSQWLSSKRCMKCAAGPRQAVSSARQGWRAGRC